MTGRRIEAGKIKRRIIGNPVQEIDYEMMFLDDGHLDELINLQEVVAESLPEREIFKLATADEFRSLLAQEKLAIGIFTEDGLVAYNIISFREEDRDNLGADIYLPRKELNKVTILKAVVVHPAYRGNHLQRRMASFHIKVVQDLGYENVCSTVSPKNPASIKNFFANGFVIRGLKIKYAFMLRYIMYKNIYKPFSLRAEATKIRGTDVEGQIDLLKRGLSGFMIMRHEQGFDIVYGYNRLSRMRYPSEGPGRDG